VRVAICRHGESNGSQQPTDSPADRLVVVDDTDEGSIGAHGSASAVRPNIRQVSDGNCIKR
jgi:hypothetical protein